MFCAVSGFVNRGDVYESQPGSFPCSVLLHVYGENDAGIIEQVVVRIIEHCEKVQVSSVAIPALCTGKLAFWIPYQKVHSHLKSAMEWRSFMS